jgi:hypothetical protein
MDDEPVERTTIDDEVPERLIKRRNLASEPLAITALSSPNNYTLPDNGSVFITSD